MRDEYRFQRARVDLDRRVFRRGDRVLAEQGRHGRRMTRDFDIPIDVDVVAYLKTLNEDELSTLHYHVEHLHRQAQLMEGVSEFDAKLPGGVDFITSKHFRNVNSAAADLENGKITADEFRTKAKTSITDSFEKAYAKGKGVKVSELTAGDREYLRRAVETELGYLDGFADDLANKRVGKPGKMSRVKRAAMYANSVEGMAWHGMVEDQPDDVEIDWVLGDAEHCPDCLLLAANSPYTKRTLPTTPRAGSTVCRTNCKCHLRFRTGKKKLPPGDEAENAYKYNAALAELLDPPVPKGLRKPNDSEQDFLDDLRTKMNYQRRRIANAQRALETATDEQAVKKAERRLASAIGLRRAYNRQLNEFVKKNGIFEVPVFSVDEVITGLDIGPRAVKDIMRDGLEGISLGLLDAKHAIRMFQSFEDQIGHDLMYPDYLSPNGRIKTIGKIIGDRKYSDLTDDDKIAIRTEMRKILEVWVGLDRSAMEGLPESDTIAVFKKIAKDKGITKDTLAFFDPITGKISMTEDVFDGVKAFAQGERTAKSRDGILTLLHEMIHSASPATAESYDNIGALLEEALTELAARRLTQEVGVKITDIRHTAYADYVRALETAFQNSIKASSEKAAAAHVKWMKDRFEKGALNPNWEVLGDLAIDFTSSPDTYDYPEHFVEGFADEMMVPDFLTEGMTKQEARDFRKKFRASLVDNISKELWRIITGD